MAQTGEMTFWDHLEELRGSLINCLHFELGNRILKCNRIFPQCFS